MSKFIILEGGWEVHSFKQIDLPPYLPFVAVARREINGVIEGFNIEGNSLDEAIERAASKIRQKYGTSKKPNK